MIRSDPPTAKMILVSAGTDPSAPVPLLAAENDDDDDDDDLYIIGAVCVSVTKK